MKNAVIIFLATVGMVACSSNQQIVRDERRMILNAPHWTESYINSDSSSNVKLCVNNVEINSRRPEFITVTLWRMPLDTIVHFTVDRDQLRSLPGSGVEDITTISYELKNVAVHSRVSLDSNGCGHLNVPNGDYFACFESNGYQTKFISTIRVVENKQAVVSFVLDPVTIDIY